MAKARQRRLITLALVAAVLTAGLIGTVDASQQSELVTTGHTEFADTSTTFNSCFAGLAGALLQRVTWFDGQTLFNRLDGGGDKWVYVTEHFNDTDGDGYDDDTGIATGDPSKEHLFQTDNTYRFDDPNKEGKSWTVHEYFALRGYNESVDSENPDFHTDEPETKKKVYVYAVRVGEPIWEDTLDREYNFAMVIDTCRFHNDAVNETEHDGADGTSGSPWGQHENETGKNEDHTHHEFSIDVWVGSEPDLPPNNKTGIPDGRDQKHNSSSEEGS